MIAAGRAGELADTYHPHPWPVVAWLRCDTCDAPLGAARSEAGHLGRWGACSDASCARLYRFVVSGEDLMTIDVGALPAQFHAHVIPP